MNASEKIETLSASGKSDMEIITKFVRAGAGEGVLGTATFESASDAHFFILTGIKAGRIVCISSVSGPGAAEYSEIALNLVNDIHNSRG